MHPFQRNQKRKIEFSENPNNRIFSEPMHSGNTRFARLTRKDQPFREENFRIIITEVESPGVIKMQDEEVPAFHCDVGKKFVMKQDVTTGEQFWEFRPKNS